MDDLSENEKKLLEKINDCCLEEVASLLNESDVRINTVDEHGMSPLEHAAYKGNRDVCKLLLDRGADVNNHRNKQGYTALMFAAIGGYKSVVSLLLEAGANVNAVNSVGRTAAQLAAFVGQHDTVSIINNFIARDDVDYYTKIRGLEKEPRLSNNLVNPLHLLACQTNVHPVKIVFFLMNHQVLIENGDKVIKVLELLCEKQFKKSDPNEILSIKFHHLAFILKQVVNWMSSDKEKEEESEAKSEKDKMNRKLEALIKTWIKCQDSSDFPVVLEKLLRQSIREFPYHESALFQQLVRTLAGVEVGKEPSAVTILSQAINGQKGFDEDAPSCGTCAEPSPSKRCSRCKSVAYCDGRCQRLHWLVHKKFCKPTGEPT